MLLMIYIINLIILEVFMYIWYMMSYVIFSGLVDFVVYMLGLMIVVNLVIFVILYYLMCWLYLSVN